VAPGLIDTHVHFRDPGFPDKETIETGAAAAKKGGFTTVVMMANTSPAVDMPHLLTQNLSKGRKTGIRVLQAAAVTKGLRGEELTDMDALAAAGAVSFTDDGFPIMDEKLLFKAMKKAAELKIPISLHEEDPAFVEGQGINDGETARRLRLFGASALAEQVLIARDGALALEAGCPLVIQHISSARSVALVRAFKALGADIHAEAAPHHFSLTEEAVVKHGTYARMNPPLRTEADRQAVIEGLRDGTIDIIATDHAPHTAAEKSVPFDGAPSGIIGLETSLALGITNLVKTGRLTLLQLLAAMTSNPAKLYRLPGGTLAVGSPADLVIFDMDGAFVAGEGGYASKSENTPFTGQRLFGRVKATVCGGKVVYED